MKSVTFLIVSLALVLTNYVHAQTHGYQFRPDVRIPISAGIELSADVSIPSDTAKYPVVMLISPYISEKMSEGPHRFASAFGFAMVWVSSRGCGFSQGTFEPFQTEAQDTYDVIDWISKQSWCNGQISMAGGSYLGYAQWAATVKKHPHLKAMVPMVSAAPGIDFPMANNMLMSYSLRWLNYTTNNRFMEEKLFEDNRHWYSLYNKYYTAGIAFSKLDSLDGNKKRQFQDFVNHPDRDAYWKSNIPSTPEQFRAIDIPMLTITGFFDSDQRGAMYYYNNHKKYGDPKHTANHYLLIGPYDHQGAQGVPFNKVAQYKVDSAAIFNLRVVAVRFINHIFRNTPRPSILKDKVNCFVIGDGWRHAPTVEALAPDTLQFYIQPQKALGTSPASAKAKPYTIAYNSADISNTIDVERLPKGIFTEPDSSLWNDYLNHKHQLVFDSSPLTESFDLIGSPVADLWLSFKKFKDIDFSVDFYEITADGKSYPLSGQAQRASYHRNPAKRELLNENTPYQFKLTNTYFIAKRLARGSTIRLVVKIVNNPGWQKNYGSGKPVSEETKADAVKGSLLLLLNDKHQSAIYLPGKK